jgi:predicted peroxiredoxin
VAGKVLVNLATGMEDAERVTVAFLVATAAVDQGKSVVIWATKDAVRLALPGEATAEACATPMWEWAGDDTTVFSY